VTVVFPFGRRQLAIHFLLGLFCWGMAVQAGWFAGQPSTFTSWMFEGSRAVGRLGAVFFGWFLLLMLTWFVVPSRFAPTVRESGFSAWINPVIPWPVDVAWADVVEVARDGRALKVVTGQGRVVRLPVVLLADGSGLTRLVRERAGHSPGVDAGS
jgi:hypothetical protein